MPTILCYGDSNTHGTVPLTAQGSFARYPRGAPWPDVMAHHLGPAFHVISEGLPGRTTVHHDWVEGGQRNGLDVLPAVLLSHVPLDMMLLMLGTNDLKPRFGVTAFEIARSLERLVGAARDLVPGLDILLITPPPLAPAGVLKDAFEGAEERQKKLDAHIAAAAERQGCGYLNAGEYLSVSPVDGVHWTREGHRDFGAAMAAHVTERLGKGAGA